MKFTLVHSNPKQRMYKSDVEITKFPNDRFNWEEEIKLSQARLKPGVSMLEDKCFYVVISDAHTHIERLVFAGMRYELPDGEEAIGPASMLRIGGAMTMMIHGGDPSSIRPDEVYLRQISILNSKKYPFNEGNIYYTIEDNAIVQSVWDSVSEELHTPTKQYFASLEEAEQSFPNIKTKHLL